MPWLQLDTLNLVISLSLTFFILFCFFTVKLLSHYFSANRVFFFLGEFKVWQEHGAPWLTSYDHLLCCELPGSLFPRRSASSRACSSEVGGSLSTFPHHHFYSFNNLLNCLWLNVSRLKTPCTSFLFAKDLAIKAAVNQLHKCIEFMIIKPSFQDLSVPLQLSRETERDTAVAVQQTAEWMEGGRERRRWEQNGESERNEKVIFCLCHGGYARKHKTILWKSFRISVSSAAANACSFLPCVAAPCLQFSHASGHTQTYTDLQLIKIRLLRRVGGDVPSGAMGKFWEGLYRYKNLKNTKNNNNNGPTLKMTHAMSSHEIMSRWQRIYLIHHIKLC